VITQEDIGKLSDPSVAESISRLTGLAGQRVNGRVQDISIRGFSGDYVTTLLNGREQASTGDNRAVEFDQYPSEVVQSVMVYKAWWWGPNAIDPNANPVVYYNNGASMLNGAELYNYSRHDVRDGLVGALEYKPSDIVHSVTDLYFSRYAQHTWDRGWEAFLCPCATGQAIANPTYTAVGGGPPPPGSPVGTTAPTTTFVTSGTYNAVQSILLNQYATTHDRLYAVGENFELDLGPWKTAADLSYSYAHRQQQWTETYAGYTPFNSSAGDASIPFRNALAGLPNLSRTLNYA